MSAHRSTRRHRSNQQSRLAELLARRDRLGAEWAERVSHGLQGVGRLTEDLMVTEWALTEGWPHLSEAWLPQWVQADARKLHDPSAGPHGGCRYCSQARQRASA
ncbi:hypothetical protein [Cellulomonas dongxiuzhuiae]|uniref:hypothetical protein n=1 Tax=Cellulomonas dongxiuzhuiae TaxID=2819979 RepID=UPI001AAFC58E|nr:hypothetical protein [Cellulomonas dongxiuzhuiae]MBO3090011.1 hypothetical protein [Cellulomonas dongxiuzhuiae]